MELSGWQTQLRKGAAELVILAVLVRGEAYGLQILERAQEAGDLVSDGALYQLLNRLEREGKLVSRWSHDEGASHPRKYYALTPDGLRLFAQMQGAWDNFSRSVSAIMEKAR